MTHTTCPWRSPAAPLSGFGPACAGRELLAQIGLSCIQLPMDIDETVLP